MNELRESGAVWRFFNDRLGLHFSEDFRGVCHFPREVADGAPVSMDRVGVAIAYNGFVGRTCCMHVVVQAPEVMSPRVIREAFEYPFIVCRCEVVLALVDSTNEAALDFDTRLGFSEFARIPRGGVDGDLVMLRMSRDECRWLRPH